MIFLHRYFLFFKQFYLKYLRFVIRRHILNFSPTPKINCSKMGYMVFWYMGQKVAFLIRGKNSNSFLNRGGGPYIFFPQNFFYHFFLKENPYVSPSEGDFSVFSSFLIFCFLIWGGNEYSKKTKNVADYSSIVPESIFYV